MLWPHLPENSIRWVWEHLREPSWEEVDRLAHEAEESGGADLPPAALRDIIRVAEDMMAARRPFPRSFEEFNDVMQAQAGVLPH